MAKLLLALSALIALSEFTQGLPQNSATLGRIVGGQLAGTGDFPWHASVRVADVHVCGGTLVSLQHVLTAAHCVSADTPSQLSVVTGTNSLTTGGSVSLVQIIYVHQNFATSESGYYSFDLSVLVLNNPLVESLLQRPIALAIEDVPVGAVAVLSGWGRTSENSDALSSDLQRLNVTIIEEEACQNHYGASEISLVHVCASPAAGTGFCHGDFGGGLIYNNQVVGIASWGNPCAQGSPEVLTRVYPQIFWIGWIIHNMETVTTMTESSVPGTTPGSNQPSLTHGNYVFSILCICAVLKRLVM